MCTNIKRTKIDLVLAVDAQPDRAYQRTDISQRIFKPKMPIIRAFQTKHLI